MIGALLLACEPTRDTLVDERRELGVVTVGERHLTVTGTFRGWHHGAGWGDDGPQLARTDVYAAFEVEAPEGMVRGDVDATWHFPDLDAGRAVWDGMVLESCTAEDRAAYRVLGPLGRRTPWHLWAPDAAGGAGGLVELDADDCGTALAWVPDAATWLVDVASHPGVCLHLAHLRRRDDAIRCFLREPPRTAGRHASRQDLPGAPDDPGFDERLLGVLTDTAWEREAHFAPYRVADMVAEVPDHEAVLIAARRLAERTSPAHPWEAWVIGRAAVATADEALADQLEARLGDPLEVGSNVATRVAAEALASRWPERAARLRARAGPAIRQDPWLPPGMPPGPPCPAWWRVTPETCPD
ncbi:MAG: hypothetical protein H6738_25025 [Alphaproteobacteria bacterium]|nr:hypothetical protein [Alphaproteobacteria bacterium]